MFLPFNFVCIDVLEFVQKFFQLLEEMFGGFVLELADSSEHSNETLTSIKWWEFLK